ncbi:MAG: Ig-like domain-containing protein [Candidatus Electryonea clarkiae]|nr:Ig-like domain-containing protein [Candidatus Electryonea clarkiae]MDP8288134.1 Ig-like domain-containing protein [Candidatus Electryonea clarkiae]
MTINRRKDTIKTIAISFVLMIFGCEGPDGPPGEGLTSVDLIPPEIQLIQPSPNDTITAAIDTFEVEASDNDSLAFVEFFIDGSSEGGSDSGAAVITVPPYSFTWSFTNNSFGAGFHILTARAVDMSENVTWIPPIPIWLMPRFGLVELYYDDTGDILNKLLLPDSSRNTGERYWNVRFSPQMECTLVALYFAFNHPIESGLTAGIDMDFFVWRESSGFLPSGIPDSVRVSAANIVYYPQWTEIDSSVFGTPIILNGDFHAGWSPAFENYNTYLLDNYGAAMIYTESETELKESEKHRSSEFELGRGWGTVQEHWGIKYDFHIRAVVDYGDGVAVTIMPNGDKQEVGNY